MEEYIGAPGGESFTDSLNSEFKGTLRIDGKEYPTGYNMSSTANNYTSDEFGNLVIKDLTTNGVENNLLDNCKSIKYNPIPTDFQTIIDKNFEKLLERTDGRECIENFKSSWDSSDDMYDELLDSTKGGKGACTEFSFGKKESEGKLSYELDFGFIKQMAERMSTNKGKYPPYNWKKSIDIEDLKQATFRHVLEIMEGRYRDDNREFGHLEALALNVMFINYQLKNGNKI